MRNYLIVFLLIAFIFTLTSCNNQESSNEPEKLSIRLSLKEGETYNLKVLTEQKISVDDQGDMEQTVEIGYKFNVEKIGEDGVIYGTVTYSSFYYSHSGGLEADVVYDSTNPSGDVPLMVKDFAFMTGKSFKIELTPVGEINSIEGVKELVEEALDTIDIKDEGDRELFEENIEHNFSFKSVKEILKNYFFIYPEDPVSQGDSWEKEIVNSTGFPMVLNNIWKFASVEEGILNLELDSKISTNPEGYPIQIEHFILDFEVISGEQKGNLKLNEKTGWIEKGEITQNINGDIGIGEVHLESKITYTGFEG